MSGRRRYGTERRAGFAVEWTSTAPGTGREIVHYWQGPDSGFGTTWSGLGYPTAVFPSRPAARAAIERCGGWRPAYKVRRVADVERDLEARGFVWDPHAARWRLPESAAS